MSDERASGPGRHPAWRIAAIVFMVALAVHAVVGRQYRSDPFASTLIADAHSYHQWGEGMARDGWSGEPVFHQAPLFPSLLALAYAPTPRAWHGDVGLLLQILLNSLAVALLVPLGRLCFGRTAVGVAAAALALLFGPVVFYAMKLLPVPLALVTQAGALAALAAARQNGRIGPIVLAGLACGLAVAARPEMLLFLPLAVALLWFPARPARPGRTSRGVSTCALLAAAAVVIAPITLHNLRQGDFVLVAYSGGENFFVGNQPDGSGGHKALHSAAGDIYSQRVIAKQLAEQLSGGSLRPSQVSRFWRHRALEAIRADPAGWLALEGRKLSRLLHPGDPTDIYSYTVERAHYLPALRMAAITPWCLFFLGALGAIAAWRARLTTAWPPAALLGTHVLVLLAFFVDSRLRLPLLFFLTLFGGYAVTEALRRWRAGTGRRLIALGGVVAVVLVISGAVLTQPRPRDALRLAAVLSSRQDLDGSLRVLEPFLAAPSPDATLLDQAGWVLQKKGDYAAAGARYHEAIAAGLAPLREPQTRTRLGTVLEQLGDFATAAEQHDAAVGSGHANAGTYHERGAFRLRRGETAAAVADFRRALQLDPRYPPPRAALRALGQPLTTH